jgi:hypothetical protein
LRLVAASRFFQNLFFQNWVVFRLPLCYLPGAKIVNVADAAQSARAELQRHPLLRVALIHDETIVKGLSFGNFFLQNFRAVRQGRHRWCRRGLLGNPTVELGTRRTERKENSSFFVLRELAICVASVAFHG